MWPNQISWPLVSEVGILGSSMHCNTSVYRITSCHVTWSNLRRQVKWKQYSFLARLWWTVHYRRNTEGSLVRQPYKPLVCYRGWDHLGPRHCSLPKAELAAAIHDSMYARVLKMEHSLTHLRLQMQYCTDGKLFVLRRLNAMTKVQDDTANNLLFADDSTLNKTTCDTQCCLDTLTTACNDSGLAISTDNTQVTYQSVPWKDCQCIIYRRWSNPSCCRQDWTKFCYLGSTLSRNVDVHNLSYYLKYHQHIKGLFIQFLLAETCLKYLVKPIWSTVIETSVLFKLKSLFYIESHRHFTTTVRYHRKTCITMVKVKRKVRGFVQRIVVKHL